MNRRDFIKYLLATPIAAEFDIEKMLWVKSTQIIVPAMPLTFKGAPFIIPLHYNIMIDNPRRLGYINNIEWSGEE